MDVKQFRQYMERHPEEFDEIIVSQFRHCLREDPPGAFKHQIVECTYDLIAHIQPSDHLSMSLYYLEQMYHFFHRVEERVARKFGPSRRQRMVTDTL